LEADMQKLIQQVDIIILQEVGTQKEESALSVDVCRRALPAYWQLHADNTYIAAWNTTRLVRGKTLKVWPEDATNTCKHWQQWQEVTLHHPCAAALSGAANWTFTIHLGSLHVVSGSSANLCENVRVCDDRIPGKDRRLTIPYTLVLMGCRQ
jgi:hypothetical protein